MRKSTPTEQQPAKQKPLVDTKLIRALWFAWRLPKLNRHQATLETTDNYLVHDTLKAIEGGDQGLAQAIQDNGPVLMLLNQIHGYPPPAGYLKILKKNASLPDDFWKDEEAVMVAEIGDPFGDFDEPALHVCRTWFDTSGNESGPEQTKLVQTDHAWRKGKEKDGKPVFYCQGCYEKRVRRIVNQVAAEAYLYPRWRCPIVLLMIDEKATKQAINRWKYRRVNYIYKLLQQKEGPAILIHNQPDDLGGLPIPMSRKELFEALYPHCQTPEGKRINGSKGFGQAYAGDKGDGRKRGGDNKKKSADEQPEQQIRIRGFNYDKNLKVCREAEFINEDTSKAGRARFNDGITWPMYIEALDTAGMKWKCTEGADALEKILEEAKDSTTYVQERLLAGNPVRNSLVPTADSVEQPPPKPLIEEAFRGFGT